MRPVTVTTTGVQNSAWIPVDYLQDDFKIGFGAVVGGTVTYTIQHTFDDVLNSAVTPTAFNHVDVAGATTSRDGNYAYPVRGIRVSATAGTGTVTLTVLQGNP